MARTGFVALVRGINVGGRNVIAMADLRRAFEVAGCDAVRTHIQSGNVLFESESSARPLEEHLEGELARQFGRDLVVVVRSHDELRDVVVGAPEGFGQQPDRFHSDVLFLRSPLRPAEVLAVVQRREGVDQAWPGDGVVYFARLSEQRTKSKLNTIVGTPPYRRLTIRSWSTTTKLLALLGG